MTPQNGEKGEAGSSPKGWIPWLISVVLSWPFLAAAFVIFLLLNPQRVQNVLLPFDSVKIFGAEFKVVGSSGANAERAIQVYREDVKKRFNKIVKSAEIDKKHKAIVDKLLDGTSGILKGVDFRSTIYVPDMLFDESLYQLLDYYPMPPTGGKKGRVFSARYGMIGRCWRSEESVFQGKVPTDPKDLVNEWAMTRKEAEEAAHGRPSFACVILRDADVLGLFYMDSPLESAFDSTWGQLVPFVTKEAASNGLIDALQKVHADLIVRSARVKIYKR